MRHQDRASSKPHQGVGIGREALVETRKARKNQLRLVMRGHYTPPHFSPVQPKAGCYNTVDSVLFHLKTLSDVRRNALRFGDSPLSVNQLRP